MDQTVTELAVSVIGLLGSVVASWFAAAAHREGKRSKASIDEINNAVNHATGTPRLYDMVLSNFQRVDGIEKDLIEIKHDVKQLSEAVEEHDVELDHLIERKESNGETSNSE